MLDAVRLLSFCEPLAFVAAVLVCIWVFPNRMVIPIGILVVWTGLSWLVHWHTVASLGFSVGALLRCVARWRLFFLLLVVLWVGNRDLDLGLGSHVVACGAVLGVVCTAGRLSVGGFSAIQKDMRTNLPCSTHRRCSVCRRAFAEPSFSASNVLLGLVFEPTLRPMS